MVERRSYTILNMYFRFFFKLNFSSNNEQYSLHISQKKQVILKQKTPKKKSSSTPKQILQEKSFHIRNLWH